MKHLTGIDAVVALDFGTANSGIAYCFTGDIHHDVYTASFEGSPGEVKVPTAILLDSPDGKTHFGRRAEKKYLDGKMKGKDAGELFTHFKMALKGKGRRTVKSMSGKERDTIEVISATLAHLKAVALKNIDGDGRGDETDADRILWVLTVPAIWSEHAKRTMRKAAHRAGLIKTEDSDRLKLALEPESASIWLQKKCFPELLRKGASFLVVDVGGGTADISAHVVTGTTPLKMKGLCAPFGNPSGGDAVNNLFLKFLLDFVSPSIQLGNHPDTLFELNLAFEKIKRGWTTTKRSARFNLSKLRGLLPMKGETKAKLKDELDAWIERANEKYGITGKDALQRKATSTLFIPESFSMEHFIEPVLTPLKGIIQDRFDEMEDASVTAMVVAGGFATSPLVGECLKSVCDDLGITYYRDADNARKAIVAGAVEFGMAPSFIESRVSPRTYFVICNDTFDEAKHSPAKKEYCPIRKENRAKDCANVFVKIGDEIKSDAWVEKIFFPESHGAEKLDVKVYSTTAENPVHVDEEGVNAHHCATLTIKLPESLRRAHPASSGVDVAFVMDCTGSMCSHMAQAKAGIEKLKTAILKDHPGVDIRFAFVGYKDPLEGDSKISPFDFQSSAGAFSAHVGGISGDGGGDECEDVYGGLLDASNLNWSADEGRAKLLFHIADAPTHGSFFAKGKSYGDRHTSFDSDGSMTKAVLRSIADKNIAHYFLKINERTNDMIQTYNELLRSCDQREIETQSISSASVMIDVIAAKVSSEISASANGLTSLMESQAITVGMTFGDTEIKVRAETRDKGIAQPVCATIAHLEEDGSDEEDVGFGSLVRSLLE